MEVASILMSRSFGPIWGTGTSRRTSPGAAFSLTMARIVLGSVALSAADLGLNVVDMR
jgi:hypothetical protein